jgi:hypothetical protein
VQVDVVITVGFSFQVNATFGFDASGVHGLIADGFSGLANANNWGLFSDIFGFGDIGVWIVVASKLMDTAHFFY